jgi:hypothetical protein
MNFTFFNSTSYHQEFLYPLFAKQLELSPAIRSSACFGIIARHGFIGSVAHNNKSVWIEIVSFNQIVAY